MRAVRTAGLGLHDVDDENARVHGLLTYIVPSTSMWSSIGGSALRANSSIGAVVILYCHSYRFLLFDASVPSR